MPNRKELPPSLSRYTPADYYDTFENKLHSPVPPRPAELLQTIFTTYPKWVGSLFKLRNYLVKPFGLQGGKFTTEHFNRMIRKQDEKEVIEEMNDKHMLFALHLTITPAQQKNSYTVQMGTVVHFHNFIGRIYFRLIAPFHRLLVPSMLKHALKEIEKGTEKSAPATS
ncbi:MAG: DUF2867 domain-containing protein [Bacteroides sp.]|nr:DUF2867 domain-containing protein [Bacteroides sp.]